MMSFLSGFFRFFGWRSDEHKIMYLEQERERLKQAADVFGRFFDSIYTYAGSYPVWKAQQDYREIILSERGVRSYRDPHVLDDYLGKLVDETKQVLVDIGRCNHQWAEGLSGARGDEFKQQWLDLENDRRQIRAYELLLEAINEKFETYCSSCSQGQPDVIEKMEDFETARNIASQLLKKQNNY